jgi:Metallo-beta-lactamase superfamily
LARLKIGHRNSHVVEHFVPLPDDLAARGGLRSSSPNGDMQIPRINLLQCFATMHVARIMAPAAQEGEISFDRSFFGAPAELVRLWPLVRRMTAGKAGPMTFTGTCSYVVGEGEVAVIDPGTDKRDHIAALLAALRGETITTILVTHTHKDHSPGARALKAATGAKIVGCGAA